MRGWSDDRFRHELERLRAPDVKSRTEAWLRSRPTAVQVLAAAFPPWNAYRVREGAPYAITSPGAIVGLVSYIVHDDDATVKVRVLRASNTLGLSVDSEIVFEIDPSWLEAWEPSP